MTTDNNINGSHKESALRKAEKLLKTIMYTSIALVTIAVILFESDILPSGTAAGSGNEEFVWTVIMELLTICIIPVAIRLLKFKYIYGKLKTCGGEALAKWGSIRMLMLCIPMVANTILYYLFMNVAFGYMGIILLLCLLFVSPGRNRCNTETGGRQ